MEELLRVSSYFAVTLILYILPLALVAVVVMFMTSRDIKHWCIADIIYLGLVLLFDGEGIWKYPFIYDQKVASLIIVLIIVVIVQTLVCQLIRMLEKIMKKSKENVL